MTPEWLLVEEIDPKFSISAQKEFLVNKKFKLIILNKNINFKFLRK